MVIIFNTHLYFLSELQIYSRRFVNPSTLRYIIYNQILPSRAACVSPLNMSRDAFPGAISRAMSESITFSVPFFGLRFKCIVSIHNLYLSYNSKIHIVYRTCAHEDN